LKKYFGIFQEPPRRWPQEHLQFVLYKNLALNISTRSFIAGFSSEASLALRQNHIPPNLPQYIGLVINGISFCLGSHLTHYLLIVERQKSVSDEQFSVLGVLSLSGAAMDPVELARVFVKTVVRMFYETEHVVVIDALVFHGACV
jgi:hypothetical protein